MAESGVFGATPDQSAEFNAIADAQARWGWVDGGSGTGDASSPQSVPDVYSAFVISGGRSADQDSSSSDGGLVPAVDAHYYQGYWAGVQAAMYGFGGALAGAALFSPFAPEAAAFEIIAIGAHIGAAIGQHFTGPSGGGGGGANDNTPGGPPFGGGRPPGWMPDSGPGIEAWDDLSSADKDLVWLAHNPDARNWVEGTRNWMVAMGPPKLPSLGENNIFWDMVYGNGLLSRDGMTPWFSPLLDMRLPEYSQAMLDQLNAGEQNTISDPTNSIRPIPIVDWYIDFNQSGRAIAMRNLASEGAQYDLPFIQTIYGHDLEPPWAQW